jgi:SCY1-like protein 1
VASPRGRTRARRNHVYGIDTKQLEAAAHASGASLASRVGRPLSLPQSLQGPHRAVLHSTAAQRPPYSSLLEAPVFFTQCTSALTFLDSLSLHSLEENQQFFRNMQAAYATMPACLLRRRLLPQMLQLLQSGPAAGAPPSPVAGAGAIAGSLVPFALVLSCALHIAKMVLAPADYSASVVPIITQLFKSSERSVRVHLLQSVREYARALTPQTVTTDILPPLLSGLRDSHPAIRELTLKALPPLAEMLSAHTIETKLLPGLTVLQGDAHAENRVHVVVCIVKLAQSLPRSHQEQLLLPVFARGLKDAHPDTRRACLRGLAASLDVYLAQACGRKILPYVAPFTVDPHPDVRAAALKLVQQLLDRLAKNDKIMRERGDTGAPVEQDSMEVPYHGNAAPAASAAAGAASLRIAGYEVPESISTAATSAFSSVSSWASNAITQALVSGTGVQAPPARGGNVGTNVGAATSSARAGGATTAAAAAAPSSAQLDSFYGQSGLQGDFSAAKQQQQPLSLSLSTPAKQRSPAAADADIWSSPAPAAKPKPQPRPRPTPAEPFPDMFAAPARPTVLRASDEVVTDELWGSEWGNTSMSDAKPAAVPQSASGALGSNNFSMIGSPHTIADDFDFGLPSPAKPPPMATQSAAAFDDDWDAFLK